MSTATLIWIGLTAGFVGAMIWAWRVCHPTKEERAEMLRHLQHLDATKGWK